MPFDVNALLEHVADQVVPTAKAWSAAPHQAIGDVAEEQLTPGAQAQLQEPLGTAATAPDEERRTDRSRADWHYVNIPPGAYSRELAEAPAHVVAAIRWAQRRAMDPRLPAEDRADAMRWLAHTVGDVTQPLHVSDAGDRGGNDLPVRTPIGPQSLHQFWDSTLPATLGDRRGLAQEIRAQDTPAHRAVALRSMDPADWARESASLGEVVRRGVAPNGFLDQAYVNANANITRAQLYRAAARLAEVLNRTNADPQFRLPGGTDGPR